MNKHQISTSIRTAFENVQVKRVVNKSQAERWASLIMDALSSKAGIIQRNDWNAHLSFETFKKLKAEGVMV